MERLDLLGPQASHAAQLEEARRHTRGKRGQERRLALGEHIGDDLEGPRADAAHARERSVRHHRP